jgi:pimeloyl-ACP methyl ester carboxylesterase
MDFTTGYAQLGDDRVAYQVIGEGSVDVVLTVGWWGSFDIEWEDAAIRSFYQHMARYARVIRFDRRGAGASDSIPLDALPPSESFAEEIECVMDAVDSDQAAIVAAWGRPRRHVLRCHPSRSGIGPRLVSDDCAIPGG